MVVLLCSYSYSSLAYDQQYTVGDTGPNGGTVTSVDVTSAITGTEVTLNGGFEDTTTTTQFTETVIEQISTSETTTQTTTQLVSTTTSNSLPTIDSSDWSTEGRVKLEGGTQCSTDGSSGAVGAGEACTGYQNNNQNQLVLDSNNHNFTALGGGQITSEQFEMGLDLTVAEIQSGFTLNYGVDVESHKSNLTVPSCGGTTGDCKDVFRVTARLYKGAGVNSSTLIGEYNNSVTLDYQGTQTHTFTQDIGTNNYSEVWGQMELWGVDAGYHTGYFGPTFSDPFMTLTYDAITTITQEITNIILSNQETVYNTSESVLTSVYIGDPIADTIVVEPIDYTEVDSFEIEIVDENGGGIELEFTVEVDEVANVASVEMSSTNLDTGVVVVEQIAEVSLVASLDSFDSGSTTVDMPSVESIEADVGAQVDVAVADAIAEIELPELDMPETTVAEVETAPAEVETAPAEVETTTTETTEPTAEVEVNTSEASSEESTTAETETSTEEASEGSESTETETDENTTETDQESSSDVEQSVDKSGEESEGSDSGESDAGGDTKESKTESKADDKGKSGDAKKGNASKRTESKEQKAKRIKEAVDKAKQKIATRILAAMADTYSAINEATKIALMQSLSDQENFKAYLDKQNALPLDWYTSEQIYTDQPQLLDPAGILYDMAQDKIMDEMIMEQYK